MKLVYLLWPAEDFSPEQRRQILLDDVAPQLLELPVNSLRILVDDEFSQVKSPAPKWYSDDELAAAVCLDLSLQDFDDPQINAIQQLLSAAGFRVGCYQVDESIYRDYGDNVHFRRRDWDDGERSPTVLAVTLLTRPRKYPHAEWMRRWHGVMSPVSETLQPRARYVRNVVLERQADAPAFDGIVEEAWPSAEHITNPYLFYCASNPLQLLWHLGKMLRIITQFHQLHKIRTVTMSEYLLKTG